MSFISGKGFTDSNKERGRNDSPFDPNDEDLGPSVSMAVMADNDHEFKKSSFGIKRTTSVGKFGIKSNQLSSLSSGNLSAQNTPKYGSQPLTPPSNQAVSFMSSSYLPPNTSDNKYQYTSPPVNYSAQDISLSSTPEQQANTNKSTYSHDPVHFQPRDDVDLSQEPSTHVDYFSHKWDESDISKSWKYIILQKKKKHTENKNDAVGLIHHDDLFSRSGSLISPSGTPQDTSFNQSAKKLSSDDMDTEQKTTESSKLTHQQQDLEIDMDAVNAARLENASWRTWAKARNNLKTVSPEIVNWSKESDITWLYGPIVPGKKMASASTQNNNDCADEALEAYNNKETTNTGNQLKPILKKRTVTEVIERNAQWKLDQIRKNYMKNHGGKLPSHRFEDTSDLRSHSPAPFRDNIVDNGGLYPHEDYNALAARVNAQYNKKSDSNLKSNSRKSDESLKNRRMVMATLLSTDKPSSDSVSPNEKSTDYDADVNKTGPVTSSTYSSKSPPTRNANLQSKHIRFNDRVEQCMAVMPANFGANSSNKTGRGSSDDEDSKRIRKRSKIVLPSGITLGTGNGGSSDESSSDEENDDFAMNNTALSNNVAVNNDTDDKPQFIEDSAEKGSKTNYALGNTRYYRGPALSDSDSSEEDEDNDDIFAIGHSSHNNNSNNSNASSSGGLFIDSMRTRNFSQTSSSTQPMRTVVRPAINKLYSEPVNIPTKSTFPPAIKILPATCLNYQAEDFGAENSPSNTGDNNNNSDQSNQRAGGVIDSHGYNNYNYNSVFTNSYILNNNAGVNVVDVPSQFAPNITFSGNSKAGEDASSNNYSTPASEIIRQGASDNSFDLSGGLSSKGSLSRTSSATSGLARGFAANLNLNASKSDLRRPDFISGELQDKPKSVFQFNQDDEDSDEESNDEDISLNSSKNSSFAAFNNTKSFSSLAGNNPKSASFLSNPPHLSSHKDGGRGVSFISGIKSPLESSSDQTNSSTKDFGAPLKKVLSRNDSSKNVSQLNISERGGRFNHNLNPPSKKSFSFFDDLDNSESE